MPGNVSQGLIWGILAIGVFITYKILDFADLTVDGSIGTGGAVAVMLITNGCPIWLALLQRAALPDLSQACSTRLWAYPEYWRAYLLSLRCIP